MTTPLPKPQFRVKRLPTPCEIPPCKLPGKLYEYFYEREECHRHKCGVGSSRHPASLYLCPAHAAAPAQWANDHDFPHRCKDFCTHGWRKRHDGAYVCVSCDTIRQE